MQNEIDWDRVAKYLRTEIAHGRERGNGEKAIERAKRIIARCGPSTHTRVMAQRIARACLRGSPAVVVPVCPDYAHDGTRYTFQGPLGTGVSLLAQRHIAFLEPLVREDLIHVELLYADQESLDERLCASAGIKADTFVLHVLESVDATMRYCLDHSLPIQVTTMTERFPELGERERTAAIRVIQNETALIQLDTMARRSMYHTIDRRMSWEEMRQRTARTAAQYLALGELASSQGWLVANHSTVNLRWYLRTEVGVLHNPTDVY